MNKINVTVFLKDALWVGIFERVDELGYATIQHIFGKEPTDAELYQFISENYYQLKFTEPLKNNEITIKRKNFKRMSREVRKEMRTKSDVKMTLSQEALRVELEKNKKLKKSRTSQQKSQEKERQFQLKQAKKKQKQCGH